MPLSSKAAHLVCADHLERLLQSFTVSSPVVTQEQNNIEEKAHTRAVGVPKTSNRMTKSPESSPLISHKGNGTGTQSGAHQPKPPRTSKPKSAKPQHNSGVPLGLTPQMMAYNTRTASSNTRSTSESTARFWTCPHCRTVFAIHQKAAHHCVRPGPSTQAPTIGPLDRFFRSFPYFPYDAHTPPAVSFSKLLRSLTS